MAVVQSFNILLTSDFAIEKKLPDETVISYATRSSDNHFAVTGTIVARIFCPLNLIVKLAIAATIKLPSGSHEPKSLT